MPYPLFTEKQIMRSLYPQQTMKENNCAQYFLFDKKSTVCQYLGGNCKIFFYYPNVPGWGELGHSCDRGLRESLFLCDQCEDGRFRRIMNNIIKV